MLDIQFIRDNPKEVALKSKQKGYEVDIPKLLDSDAKRRGLLAKVEELRKKRNEFAATLKQQKPTAEQLQQGRDLKEQLVLCEADLNVCETSYMDLLKQVPNMPLTSVPVGSSEDENVVVKQVGIKQDFDFVPKTHWEIAEARDLIDKDRAGKVTGSRFAYIKGNLVRLQFAIIQYVLDTLTSEEVIARLIQANNLKLKTKPFIPVLPPAMVKTDVFAAMDRLEPREDRYKVGADEDDLWLQGSAEHTLGPMYKDEILDEQTLPVRYLGYATSFRREAGTYGKDTEGIIRMHQFDKLEMEVFSSGETGYDEHLLLCAIQEYLVTQLQLPYQVLQKCTFDIGKPNAVGVDIEIWMPGQGKYRETHTADYMTDYQSRRLKTRTRYGDGRIGLIHTNDATAFALGRTMVAIIENYQNADGTIRIPDVLRPYMGPLAFI